MNQGSNIVQNINQTTVSNNVAQEIVQQRTNQNVNSNSFFQQVIQQANNSNNVGDGLPYVPEQNNTPNNLIQQANNSNTEGRGLPNMPGQNNTGNNLIQQANNSNNVGDGLPNVPEQNNLVNNNVENEPAMSQWFINHLAGRGERTRGGDIILDYATVGAPAGMLIAPTRTHDYSNVKEDIPDFGDHGHSNFTGDWARKASDGTFYRPTSANDWR